MSNKQSFLMMSTLLTMCWLMVGAFDLLKNPTPSVCIDNTEARNALTQQLQGLHLPYEDEPLNHTSKEI